MVTVQSVPRIYCDTAGVPWQIREMKDDFVTVQSAPRIYCDTAGVPWQVRDN